MIARYIITVLVAVAGFAFLGFYFREVETRTTVESLVVADDRDGTDGFTCTLMTPMQPRTVTYLCGGGTSGAGAASRCADVDAATGFGGQFHAPDGSPGDLLAATRLQLREEQAVFYRTHAACMANWTCPRVASASATSGREERAPYIMEDGGGEPVYVAPAISSDGRIFAVTGSALQAVFAPTGTSLWSYVGVSQLSAPVLSADEQTIFVACNCNGLVAVDAATGASRWSYSTNSSPRASSPAVSSDGLAVFIATGSQLHAVDAASGAARWVYEIGGAYATSPIFSATAQAVFVVCAGPDCATAGGYFHAVNATTGSAIWVYNDVVVDGQPTSEQQMGPAVSNDGLTVFAVGKLSASLAGVALGPARWALHAIDAGTGRARWTYYDANSRIQQATVSRDGLSVYVVADDGYTGCVHAVEATSGVGKWIYTGDSRALRNRLTVSANGETVFAGFRNGLHAINTSGDAVYTKAVVGQPASASALPNGGVAFGTTSAFLYILPPLSERVPSRRCAIQAFETGAIEPSGTTIHLPAALPINATLPADIATACSAMWASSAYCATGTPQFESMRTSFCDAYRFHPPYACTRTVETKRPWLEALSLSFSVAELLYIAIMYLICRVLWARFQKKEASKQAAAVDGTEGKIEVVNRRSSVNSAWQSPV